jgi:hypothetical protein
VRACVCMSMVRCVRWGDGCGVTLFSNPEGALWSVAPCCACVEPRTHPCARVIVWLPVNIMTANFVDYDWTYFTVGGAQGMLVCTEHPVPWVGVGLVSVKSPSPFVHCPPLLSSVGSKAYGPRASLASQKAPMCTPPLCSNGI